MKFNNLNKLRIGGTGSTMQLAVRPPRTPAGRVYRMSPNSDAHPRHFVMGDVTPDFKVTDEARARMKLQPRSQQTVCPYSGVIAADMDFLHPDDHKAAIDVVKDAALADAHAALSDMLKNVARGSKYITYKPGPRPHVPKRRFHRDDLLRELICDHCGRDYGVYAIGLFCPDCGAPNVRLHFERERQLVDAQVQIAEAQADGLEELAYRLLGNAHEDVLTAFEATLKTVYLFGIANRPEGAQSVKPVGNDFQNLERAQKRFHDLSFDPFAGLDEADLATLQLNIQKRHIIGHNLGVVDSRFAEHAEEARLGETVQLVGDDVRRFAMICQSVVDALDEWLCGAPSPTIGRTKSDEGKALAEPKAKKPVTLDDISLDISQLAKEIALWMAHQSPKGLGYLAQGSDLKAAFVNATPRDLSKALAELENERLVELAGGIGRDVPQPFPTSDLYAIFDPVAFGTDPHEDACDLIRRILAKAKSEDSASYGVSSPQLLAETNWSHRRLNPALSLVVAQVDSGRVSKSIDGEFAARSFHIMASDELALEHFLKRVQG